MEDLNDIKELLKSEVTIDYLCNELEIEELKVYSLISKLKLEGYNIVSQRQGDTITFINMGVKLLTGKNTYKIDMNFKNNVKVLVVSDTRFGSVFAQPTILSDAYDKAYKYGCDFALHAGNITEGIYSKSSPYYGDLYVNYSEGQVNLVKEQYPFIEDFKTYFIAGQRDLTHKKAKDGIDIGKSISKVRNDLMFLGDSRSSIGLFNSKILLFTPIMKFKQPYQISYKLQNKIKSIRSEDKCDILLMGGLTNLDHINTRNIDGYQIPGMVSTTTKMENDDIQNIIGYWILDMYFDNKGNLVESNPLYSVYYENVQNDVYPKVLKIGGNK